MSDEDIVGDLLFIHTWTQYRNAYPFISHIRKKQDKTIILKYRHLYKIRHHETVLIIAACERGKIYMTQLVKTNTRVPKHVVINEIHTYSKRLWNTTQITEPKGITNTNTYHWGGQLCITMGKTCRHIKKSRMNMNNYTIIRCSSTIYCNIHCLYTLKKTAKNHLHTYRT